MQMGSMVQGLSRREFVGGMAAGIAGVCGLGLPAFAEEREGGLIVHTKTPMNAEPALADLVKSWMTPVDRFYVRSHAPVPKIDTDAFRLKVEGLVETPLSISLAQLRDEFDQHSAIATMTCAGNRRSEHSLVKPVKGVPWGAGPIGNAKWGGVRLSDVLTKAGLKPGARHVWFEGLDEIPRSNGTIPFGASIPVAKALADTDVIPGTLLTTHMNDAPLTGDHGAPLRTVVPGYIGARSVKWLGKIVVADRPSENHYVATAYKLVEEGTPLEWSEQAPIYRMPLNSVICSPGANASVKSGKVGVAGYALPPGRPGTTIAKVEVSADGGRSWTYANIVSPARANCWVLWQAAVRVDNSTTELTVRATDSRGEMQPENVRWNQKGYLFNAWHEVPIATL